MRKITGIIIHCAATRPEWMAGNPLSDKIAEIRRWHVKGNGWADIGYHHLIDRNGEIGLGRPLEKDGAHVQGHNRGTIGICLIGGHGSGADDDFAQHYTKAQDAALRSLIAELRARFGTLPLSGHNEYAAKACPGFRVSKWWAARIPVSPQPAPSAPSWLASIITTIANLFRRAQ